MKLIITSDTHGNLPPVEWCGSGDVFIHAGDICNNYSREKYIDAVRQADWLGTSFVPWINEISTKFKHCLFIFGNHDRVAEHKALLDAVLINLNNNVHLLSDSSFEVDGQKIFGTPWINLGTLRDNYWAHTKASADLIEIRNQIPEDTNILITHTPPYNILDEENHYGDPVLNDRINKLSKLHTVIMGHCHLDGNKKIEYNGITYYNTAENIMNLEI